MKKLYIGLVFLFGFFLQKSYSQQDTILAALLLINENEYLGKSLDSIIIKLPQNNIEMKIISGGHQFTARKLRVRYPNNVWIELHVRDFNFMNPLDINRVWNIPLMRMEHLYRVAIYKDTVCYAGCDVF